MKDFPQVILLKEAILWEVIQQEVFPKEVIPCHATSFHRRLFHERLSCGVYIHLCSRSFGSKHCPGSPLPKGCCGRMADT